MNIKKTIHLFIIITLLFLFSTLSVAQIKERKDLPVKDKWRLEDIYSSNQTWNSAKQNLSIKIKEISKYKGKLGSSATSLHDCLELNSAILREIQKVRAYAFMKYSEDTRNSTSMAMKQEIEQLQTEYSSLSSFIQPEIIQTEQATIGRFIQQEEGLKIYKKYINEILRTKEHKLSDKEERILAESDMLGNSPSSIYSVFKNAELPYPTIKLSDGTEAYLDASGYARFRASSNRDDREKVFKTYWDTMSKFQKSLGEMLYAQVKRDIFYAKTRNYGSALESALDANNIPTDVYLALIKNVNKNLDTFFRYLKIKKRMLGVETLKYSDLYAPTVKGIELQYDIEDAKKLVQAASAPLGKEYLNVVNEAFTQRWIDVYPSPGKRAGAYASTIYDVHPYIFLNYNQSYQDVSTLAHELGHLLHSYLADRNQPFILSDYSIFVAEVASTFNEALLMDKMLQEVTDDDVKLSLLMNYLDGIKGTLFRQTQFAEFELRIHEKAEKGDPLTAEVFTEIYGNLLKTYYGHDRGICQIDDLYCVEWSYIPHFFYNFYVYQYATSYTASIALAEKVLNKEEGAIENYLNFLKAGDSEYPIPLLKSAGVDMTTSLPFEKTMQAMNRAMDEMENILDKKGL